MTADKSEGARPGGSGLNFSLPSSAGQRGGARRGALVAIGVLIIVLQVALLAAVLVKDNGEDASTRSPAELESLKKLALRLEDRGLPERAARAWLDYIEAADLAPAERAQKLAHAAEQYVAAKRYEDAIVLYFRADQLGPSEEVTAAINRGVRECFTRLGKHADLYYELAERTSLGSEDVPDGSAIVAEIGPRKITLSQFERMLDDEIRKATESMPEPQAKQYAEYLRKQYASPEAKQQKLGEIVGREVLAREAKERKVDQSESFKQKLAEFADQLMVREVIEAETAKINLSDNDCKLYYEANASKYKEPAKAKISRILLDDEQAARDLLATLKTAEDFAAAAKEKSKDGATKEKGGEIAAEVRPGQWVPGIGRNQKLNDAIFASKAGAVLDEVYKSDDGFNLVLVREKTAERQKAFDEVKEQVRREYEDQKRREVIDALVQSLFEKHKVTLHPGVLAPATPRQNAAHGKNDQKDDE